MRFSIPGYVRVLAMVIGVPMLAVWFSHYVRSPERNRVSAEPLRVDETEVPRFDDAFWSVWGDGRAELSGYDLVYPKYGQPRRGSAVAIFVTETFSNRLRVKADPGKHPVADEFPVMKLNLVKDYQTGVYDYNDMTSVFVALGAVNGRPQGSASKVSFSSQEWCGQVYEQLLFDFRTVRTIGHSYFEGEADWQREIDYPDSGFSEDVLPLWARGMARPLLEPGASRDVRSLMSVAAARETHKPVVWRKATLARSAAPRTITVPAGTFSVDTFTAQIDGAPVRTFYVERDGARRIIQWESSTGEKGQLLASDRQKYWELNKPGGEEMLKKLGLQPRPPKTT